jgi:asparagine synthase (glutamine-hydrolysing)
MCGVSGYFSRFEDMDYSNALDASLKNQHYRGPDAQSKWMNKRVGLAHARLSIIDLSSKANQPMHDEANHLHIVFNGEIYNYKSLKSELLKKGYAFQSESDTEVLLQGYKYWGVEVFERLNGMFVIAIYDENTNEIIVARDRFGIKPLYYYLDERNFFFASEMGSLLSFPIKRKLNHAALNEYFRFSYIPNNQSILKNIVQLEPGSFLRITNNDIERKKYYSIESKRIDISYNDALKGVSDRLNRSVERRLLADVPVATFLSGGIDSSIITMLAAQNSPGIHSYSAGFSEYPYFDEAALAKIWGQKLAVKHSVIDLRQDELLASIDNLITAISEPFADTSTIAYYLLSKKVAEFNKVVLSGDGADELFGGYRKHKAEYLIRKYPSLSAIASTFGFVSRGSDGSRNSKLGNIKRQINKWSEANKLSNEERYFLWASMATENERDGLLLKQEKGQQWDSNYKSINDILKKDMEMVLPGDMLYKVDRSSMLHSLEVRVPFLDHELVDYVFSLPSEWKLKGGMRKAILKDAFQTQLSKELIARNKKGFEVPIWDWLRGPLKDKVDAVLNEEVIRSQGVLNYSKVQLLLKQSRSEKPGNTPYLIWAIFVFQQWMNKINPEL